LQIDGTAMDVIRNWSLESCATHSGSGRGDYEWAAIKPMLPNKPRSV
jgi:hypothetical protein